MAMTKILQLDFTCAKNTIEYQRIHVEKFLPFNSKESLIATFNDDGEHFRRIKSISSFIENEISSASTVKNAESFITLLTNANFRSLFLWTKGKSDTKNAKINYDVIEPVPKVFREFVENQRIVQEANFNLKNLDHPQEFNPQLWMRTIRKSFRNAVDLAYRKALEVEKLGNKFPWHLEIAVYGNLQQSMNRLSDLEKESDSDIPIEFNRGNGKEEKGTMTLDVTSSNEGSS
jgi:hypothetical protein